jgi:hypothetical protein
LCSGKRKTPLTSDQLLRRRVGYVRHSLFPMTHYDYDPIGHKPYAFLGFGIRKREAGAYKTTGGAGWRQG